MQSVGAFPHTEMKWIRGYVPGHQTSLNKSLLNHEVCHPRCVIRLIRLERMCLSNSTSFVGRDMYKIYCIRYNYRCDI